MSEYTLTLPFFVCQEWGNQCVRDCNGDNACASSCREDNPCGASDPSPAKDSTTSRTSKPTASVTEVDDEEETKIFSGSAGGSDDDSPGAGVALEVGRGYGLAIVLGGLFVGFALL